ncbi:MAG: hypothetical protein RSC92_03930 [Clostridia bacterium]
MKKDVNINLNESIDKINNSNNSNNLNNLNKKSWEYIPDITDTTNVLEIYDENLKDNTTNYIYETNNENKDLTLNNSFKYVGSIFNTYCIIELDNKIYIIDRHAAHERLLFEKIKKCYYSEDKDTQLLAIPVIVELKKNEMDLVYENIHMFEDLGYELESFDDKSYKISGIPNDMNLNINIKEIFLDLVDELQSDTKTLRQEKEKRFLYTIACKAAVKANMKLTIEEDIALITDMMNLVNPFTCPHGRPIAYEISKYEIEKNVSRK